MLVFNSWETTHSRKSKRWGREPEPDNLPAQTGLCRATIVDSTQLDEAQAQQWLESLGGDELDATVDDAITVLNLAIRAHRASASDPTIREVNAEGALTVRAGYGIGEEVAEGAWTAARDLDMSSNTRRSRRERRAATLRPQERLAAVLGGRDAILACEELALRARLDVDSHQYREGALQTHVAVEAAIAEFQAFRDQDSIGRRLEKLEEFRGAVSDAANEALQGGLKQETIETVVEGLRQVESLLRARSATAQY